MLLIGIIVCDDGVGVKLPDNSDISLSSTKRIVCGRMTPNAESLPTDESPLPPRTERRLLAIVLIVAGLLRLALICWRPESLAEDRDLYWGIAERLAAGDGYVHPTFGHPTAYRPPAYPFLLATILAVGGGIKTLAAAQIAMSVATVWLTWSLGRKLELGAASLIAAAFVALNPLLVQSASLAMTETVCMFLIMAGLRAAYSQPMSYRSVLATGFCCGLVVLCRPTAFLFVQLSTVIATVLVVRRLGLINRVFVIGGLFALTSVLPAELWAKRNHHIFCERIITTTHGGYTLLLGNNDEAYRAEVAQPFGTVWDSRTWQQTLDEEMTAAGLKHSDEVGRDRYLSNKAWAWIRQNPGKFAAASWLRVRRFWNISPSGADAETLPRPIRWGVAIFFLAELSLAAVGLCRLRRSDWSRWWPLLVLIVSFSAVHVVYWSNLRMRAPIEPALALLATFGVMRFLLRRPVATSHLKRFTEHDLRD